MHAAESILILLAVALPGVSGPTSPTLTGPPLAPDFHGTWVLDPDASDFGMSPPPDSAVTVITRADDRLVMTRNVFTGMMGHNEIRIDMPTDGATHDASTLHGGTTPATARWKEDALVLTIVAQSNVGDIEIMESMTVSDDTMTIARTLSVPGMGPLEQLLVLHRRR